MDDSRAIHQLLYKECLTHLLDPTHQPQVDHLTQRLYRMLDWDPTNIIIKVNLAKLLKISYADFETRRRFKYYIRQAIDFPTPYFTTFSSFHSEHSCTIATLGYMADQFNTHATNLRLKYYETEHLDRYEMSRLSVPDCVTYTYAGHTYSINLNCYMDEDHIQGRYAQFEIGPITYYKTNIKTRVESIHRLNYSFICEDDSSIYYGDHKVFNSHKFVVLDCELNYEYDTFDNDSRAKEQMNELVNEYKKAKLKMPFFHFFLEKLPIEKRLVYIASFLPCQHISC